MNASKIGCNVILTMETMLQCVVVYIQPFCLTPLLYLVLSSCVMYGTKQLFIVELSYKYISCIHCYCSPEFYTVLRFCSKLPHS